MFIFPRSVIFNRFNAIISQCHGRIQWTMSENFYWELLRELLLKKKVKCYFVVQG